MGLEFKFDGLINPRLDCSQSPLGVRLSPEELVALDLHDPKVAGEYRRLAERGVSQPAALDDNLYFCGGGMNSFAVDPYGNMAICVLSQQHTYNIRQGSVRAGWEQFLLAVRSRKRRQLTKCQECRIQSLCSMCPANGELEQLDPESPVDFLCQVAHLRAMALGVAVPAHGACECCAGGEHHVALAQAAQRIASKQIDVGAWHAPVELLPVLQQAPPAAGARCSGCRG
jgi:radical SAM protein with 4Fe4S-binding SPASM domain